MAVPRPSRRPQHPGGPTVVAEPASYPRRRDVRAGAGAGAVAPREAEVRAEAVGGGPVEAARGHHASGLGDGFGRLVGLTILGAAVPGAGLYAAGRRVTGGLLLALDVLVVAAAAALLLSGRAVDVARRFVFHPGFLLAAAVAIVVVALVWVVVIVASHLALRRNALTGAQRALSVVLVTALMALVAVPAATAAQYTMTSRSLLQTVFGEDGRSGPGADVAAADPWADLPRVNVLLVGADTGDDRTGTRPDTVMVASIDTATGDTVLFSLPRQLEDIPFESGSAAAGAWPEACEANGAGGCLLNATWLFGEQYPELFPGAEDPGLAATREAAGSVVGLPIHYEAAIDLKGFEDLVNAMGGLTIDVPRDIPIGGGAILRNGVETGRKYPVTDWIRAGEDQKLDGYQALWFARSREGSDNNERMDRQRCVIDAAVREFDVVRLARAFPQLAASAEENLETDIAGSELNAFIELGQRVKAGSLRSLSFTSENIDTGNPDYAALQGLVQQALVPPAPAPAPPAPSSPGPAATPAPAPAPAQPVDPDQAVDTSTVC